MCLCASTFLLSLTLLFEKTRTPTIESATSPLVGFGGWMIIFFKELMSLKSLWIGFIGNDLIKLMVLVKWRSKHIWQIANETWVIAYGLVSYGKLAMSRIMRWDYVSIKGQWLGYLIMLMVFISRKKYIKVWLISRFISKKIFKQWSQYWK